MSDPARRRLFRSAATFAALLTWGCVSSAPTAPSPAVRKSSNPPRALPPRQRNPDPQWDTYKAAALEGAPEVREFLDAYEALVLTNVRLLPVTLPGTPPYQLFTAEELEERLATLSPGVAAGVREKIAEQRRRPVEPSVAAFLHQYGMDMPGEPDRLLLYSRDPRDRDLSRMVGEADALAIEAKLDVLSLTDQPLFAVTGGLKEGSLPTSVTSLVVDELARLKAAAARRRGPPAGQPPEVHLLFRTPKTGLWLDTDDDIVSGAKEIRFSPALVRAVFVQTTRQIAPSVISFFRLRSRGAYNRLAPSDVRRLLAVMVTETREARFCFQRSVSFGIAHELAHAWLGAKGDAKGEDDADEAARAMLDEIYGDPWLGLFNSLLLRAFLENAPEAWALNHPDAAALRLRLEKLRARLPAGGPAATRCERSVPKDRSR